MTDPEVERCSTGIESDEISVPQPRPTRSVSAVFHAEKKKENALVSLIPDVKRVTFSETSAKNA